LPSVDKIDKIGGKRIPAANRHAAAGYRKTNMRYFARYFAIAATLLVLAVAPARAQTADEDTRFGAALALLFDSNCRPVGSSASQEMVDVLGRMTAEELTQNLKRAQKLLTDVGKKAFCGLFEEIIESTESTEI
jgi:hypothetical protein